MASIPRVLALLALLVACSGGDEAVSDAPASPDALRSDGAGPAGDAAPADAPPVLADASAGFECQTAVECGGYPCCGQLLAASEFDVIGSYCGLPSCQAGDVRLCDDAEDCFGETPRCGAAPVSGEPSFCQPAE